MHYYLAVPAIRECTRHSGTAPKLALGDAEQSRTLSTMNCARCKDAGIVRQVEYLNVENANFCTCDEGSKKWEEIEKAIRDLVTARNLCRPI